MDIILDETSLVPTSHCSAVDRICELANVLKTLDGLGTPKLLRCVRDAADRNIELGRGLKIWCFDRQVDQVAGKLIASRLSKQPFIDGPDGLFAQNEGVSAVEPTIEGMIALGAGLAVLTDGALVALKTKQIHADENVSVCMRILSDDGESSQNRHIARYLASSQVLTNRTRLIELIESSVRNGAELLIRQIDLYPRLRIGSLAFSQFSELNGNEIIFKQLLRHLRALNDAAASDERFEPAGISESAESNATLNHSKHGPIRDFPAPDGFENRRWSKHSKLTGGAEHRLYFCSEKIKHGYLVLIGYFGPKLSTVMHKV